MAPKRILRTVVKKSVGTNPAVAASPRVTRALLSPSKFSDEAAMGNVRRILTSSFRGAEVVAYPWDGGEYAEGVATFHIFSTMGLLPPFSKFFFVVLEAYGLAMLHLHPNAVRILAVFAYACEAFVGVRPSVALFRNFFVPRLGKSKWIAGGVTFHLRDDVEDQFPEMITMGGMQTRKAHNDLPRFMPPEG